MSLVGPGAHQAHRHKGLRGRGAGTNAPMRPAGRLGTLDSKARCHTPFSSGWLWRQRADSPQHVPTPDVAFGP